MGIDKTVLIQTRRERLAWAAGFFDGEGSFTRSIQSRGNCETYTPIVKISQFYEPEVLHDFMGIMGFGNVTGPYSQKLGKEIYHYEASGFPRFQAIYASLYIFLGSVKREQGRKILLEYRNFELTRVRHRIAFKNTHRAR